MALQENPFVYAAYAVVEVVDFSAWNVVLHSVTMLTRRLSGVTFVAAVVAAGVAARTTWFDVVNFL